MKKYTITRFKQDKTATLGKWTGGGLEICATIEPPWRDNQRDNSKTKENEASCIPEGIYKCVPFSGTHHQDVWQVLGVPGRSEVLIHHGNYAYQSKACILVGDKHTEYKGMPMVNNSVNMLKKLRLILPKEFILEIKCDGFVNDLCQVDKDEKGDIKKEIAQI